MNNTELDRLYKERIAEILAGVEISQQTAERINNAMSEALRESLRPLVKDAVAQIIKGLK